MADIERFKERQSEYFATALAEIRNGKKLSHWMWYIFPQLRGLGQSETSRYYGITGIAEAEDFLNDGYLGENLILISSELLKLPGNDAASVFGEPDDMKLRSSMTLFAHVRSSGPVFKKVLDKYFGGREDPATLKMLGRE